MSRRDRSERGGEKSERSRGSAKRGRQNEQGAIVDNLMQEVRTLDSEVDLLKQKMNAIIRQINILKRVLLSEKKEIKDVESEQLLEKDRLKGILEVVRDMKGEEQ